MTTSAALLSSLEAITHETTQMLSVLDDDAAKLSANDRREAKRRVIEIRTKAQELFEWISEARLEEPRN